MTREEILLQIIQLREVYHQLRFDGTEETGYRISGNLSFTATHENETIEDLYQIQVLIPNSYPRKLPVIKETGGRVPSDFHTNPDGTLCLEAPIKLYMVFNENPTLLHFINNCALPFFYSYSYQRKHGVLPFGDRAHGGEGLLQMYKEFFQLTDELTVVAIIKILAENKYKGSELCPCQSGKKLFQCHGPKLREIEPLQGSKYFAAEYIQMIDYLHQNNVSLDKGLLSKTALKKFNKLYSNR